MIVESLLTMIFNLFNSILSALNIPGMPEEMTQSFDTYVQYLYSARNLVALFLPINLTPYFTLFACIFGFKYLYPLLMWVLRKIPMLGIK